MSNRYIFFLEDENAYYYTRMKVFYDLHEDETKEDIENMKKNYVLWESIQRIRANTHIPDNERPVPIGKYDGYSSLWEMDDKVLQEMGWILIEKKETSGKNIIGFVLVG